MIFEAEKKGYIVSKSGEVFSKNRQLKLYFIEGKYLCFTVVIGDKKDCLPVHRYQAYKKFGNRMFQSGIVVRHLDGDCRNNSWGNIAIGSQRDNIMDIPAEKRKEKAISASGHIRKFSNAEMLLIREFYKNCKSYKQTMEKFNISSKGTLHRILNIEYITEKVSL